MAAVAAAAAAIDAAAPQSEDRGDRRTGQVPQSVQGDVMHAIMRTLQDSPVSAAAQCDEEPAHAEVLVRHLQNSGLLMSCERAEFYQERAELQARVAEAEARLQLKHNANEALVRRVRMLEHVLHKERWQHAKELTDAGVPSSTIEAVLPLETLDGASTPRSGSGTGASSGKNLFAAGGQSRRSARLELLLQRKQNKLSARQILEFQSYG
eukprot:TRINITY_DN29891_c0_g1_i1.p1 TRINITY_DN29891_c0_g1~~TRINITY_DN29891_c0_g1_i1.p1  ORF type:complete len:232 (+),score=61.62 TRINITY_DN29891_c0_g1_i1:68-697(+)